MKNLHKIGANLSEHQLAHLWYYVKAGYNRTRVRNGIPERWLVRVGGWSGNWWTDGLSGPYIIREWFQSGKPMPDMSKVESIS